MKVQIKVDDALGERARQIGRDLEPAKLDMFAELADTGVQVARRFSPRAAGAFYRSITSEHDASGVTIGSTSRLAHVIERGRRPGKLPPPAAIAAIWGLAPADAYAMSARIGRRGTAGRNVFARTRDVMVGEVEAASRRLLESASFGGS